MIWLLGALLVFVLFPPVMAIRQTRRERREAERRELHEWARREYGW